MMIRFILLIIIFIESAAIANDMRPGVPAIATAHPLATAAGKEILNQGGNAFDAAIAVAATLAVVEPYSSGLGGGGFWLLQRSNGSTVMIDAREKAPLAAHAKLYLDDDGQLIEGASVNGPLAAGIPGAPAGLAYLAEHYGRLELAQSLAAAIKIAQDGFTVDQIYRKMVARRLDALRASPDAADIFLVNNEIPNLGERIIQKDLADTMQLLAQKGAAGFYEGAVAEKLVTSVRDNGGIWSLTDLAQYQIVERQPIRINYYDTEIISATLPSSGGILLGIIFNTLEKLNAYQANPTTQIHYAVEVMRRAYHDRARYLGDMDFVDVPIARLLSDVYAGELARSIDSHRATPSLELSEITKNIPESEKTTHYSIIDADGNRVAATLSINYAFGSGFVAKDTGILLNDEMDDFVAKPGVPNLYGLVGSTANEIAAGKRMLSSMSPTFVDDGKRLAILGTPGGSRIITMVLLAIMRFMEGDSATGIVSARRYHHQYLPDEISFEPGSLSVDTQRALVNLGHKLQPYDGTYGNMQIVIWDYGRNKMDAASDPRGIGEAWIGNP
ncbi:MAG: gamma-glutamyltransferase [Chromatiales bacterium]|nr:gamma-glutamyltransferase [Chromatiales bacterium]